MAGGRRVVPSEVDNIFGEGGVIGAEYHFPKDKIHIDEEK